MNEHLQILGPEHGHWQGWPSGALTLYTAIMEAQWQIWTDAGSPRPAPNALLAQMNGVMHQALETELGRLLSENVPDFASGLQDKLRTRQHAEGMLSTDDIIPAL
ncbi:hypothetical protein [Pseudoxanthomonas sp. JBR18]|uniref:hypothetical protein n=1 Tax=Pseudoxanthomonas sp. JBR18 TaxID=2969308 RepID=UPI0023054251|nr:hypothetical protein [Pseudoxanthomonas sp. JBR18]WCE03899.1 hypothetical protein PJ250_17725 [Pseudoxanthomonas sp. JBR18]